MSKGYTSEDAQDRMQRAKKPAPEDEEAAAERALAAAKKALAGRKPPR